jgi:hypothetical protein
MTRTILPLMFATAALACGSKDSPSTGPDRGAPFPDAGVPVSDGPPGSEAGDADAAFGQRDATSAVPVLITLSPLTTARGADLVLTVLGEGFADGAAVFLDGQVVPTTRESETRLRAEIAGAATAEAGFHPVWAETGGARSNLVYLSVTPPPGWPEVVDLKPDNGMPGDAIRLVGFNLTGESLTIRDPAGHTTPGAAIGTVNGANAVFESVEFALPGAWQSGPLPITSSAGTFRARVFNVGRNLALLPGVKASASSEYGGTWTIPRGADNDLFTSWFPAAGDCVSAGPPTCHKPAWYMITFPAPQTVTRIALRGYRDYGAGYSFLRGRFEVLGEADAILWARSYDLPVPARDLEVPLPAALAGATAVRFTGEKDESEDPGFGEIEVF